MYAEHQPRIAEHARTPEGFADVVTFVIATINQHFYRVGTTLDTLRHEGIDAAPMLTQLQKRGIAYVRANAHQYTHLAECKHGLCAHNWCLTLLKSYIELPSIGLIKAGFIAQLVHGEIGCLDRHNLRAAGLDGRTFNRIPTSAETLTARCEMYVHACTLLGTSAQLWDGWCALIAAKYPQHFQSAEDVSQKHLAWIIGA